MKLQQVVSSIVQVGAGRGFIVQEKRDFRKRLVITAAHCLPFLPPCHAGSLTEERTFGGLLGPVGGEPAIWTECLFVDPVADIAILGEPDGQELPQQWEQYDTLVQSLEPIEIADAPAEGQAWLLSLDMQLRECFVTHNGGRLWLGKAADGIHGGMSGSPVLLADGSACGLVAVGASDFGAIPTEGGPNPRLMYNLPGWCLQALRSVSVHGQ